MPPECHVRTMTILVWHLYLDFCFCLIFFDVIWNLLRLNLKSQVVCWFGFDIFLFWFLIFDFFGEMQLNLVNNTKLPTVDTTTWRLSGWVFKKIKVWFWEFFFFIRKKLRSRHLFYYFLRENKTRNKTFSFLFDWLNG